MGTDKNIKLHIVTDIKRNNSSWKSKIMAALRLISSSLICRSISSSLICRSKQVNGLVPCLRPLSTTLYRRTEDEVPSTATHSTGYERLESDAHLAGHADPFLLEEKYAKGTKYNPNLVPSRFKKESSVVRVMRIHIQFFGLR